MHIVIVVTLQGDQKQGKVTKLSKNEVLMLNIGSMSTGAKVLAVSSLLCDRHTVVLH